MSLKIHIVSFDVPFPPNYGGVIDVFYKIKNLHKLGVIIYLHTFEYGRGKQNNLELYCKSVNYYNRKSLFSILSRKPYIVNSRKSHNLIENLKKDEYPILFEGLHTTYPLINTAFNHRKIIIRTHNIEHDYYLGLAKSEKSFYKKIFFNIESKKLKLYEEILHKTTHILTISPLEHHYFTKKFENKSIYIPVFHKEKSVARLSKKGKFALYHGDLRVPDNIKAVFYLMDVFKDINYPLIIASSFLNKQIEDLIKNAPNVEFEQLDYKNKDQLDGLFKNAHINVLPTFQATGIKLKLIHALFSSRFCVVTPKMVSKTGLENLCGIGKTKSEFKDKIIKYVKMDYSKIEIEKKINHLETFNTLENAQKIIDLI